MRFECQHCKTAYSISDGRVRGKVLKIRCRNCGQMVEVREQSSPRMPASTPPEGKKSRPPSSPSAPDAPLSRHLGWYVGLDGTEEGPLSEEEIAERVRAGRISASFFAWREGMDDWRPLVSIPELASLFSRPPRPPPAPAGKTGQGKSPQLVAADKDRSRDVTLFDAGAGDKAGGAAGGGAPPATGGQEGESSRLDLLERVHRKRQQVRADRQADRIAEYFFQSTDLLGETPNLPPPPVAGVEPLAERLDKEAEQERTGESLDPLARLVRRDESLEEISKITKVLADQARVGVRDTGRRLGVTLALVFGLVGMVSGFIALGVSKGWFSAIGLNFLGGAAQKSGDQDLADLDLSPEESRRLREQLWMEKRKAAGGSALSPGPRRSPLGAGEAPISERERQLLAFYQQEAERKREVMPRQPKDLLGLAAPTEISLPGTTDPLAFTPANDKREVVPQAPERLAATGELSEAQIKQVIDSHYPQLKKCLEHQLKRDARVSGKLLVTALVTPQGKVTRAWIPTQKFHGTFVEECLIKEVQRWEFPAFTGPTREVSFPLLLSPQVGG